MLKKLVGPLVAAFLLSLAVAAPAHAYGQLTERYALVDTDNCNRLAGNLTVVDQGNGCFLDDSIDDTFFEKQAGGIAVKIVLSDSQGIVSKVEFHPLGDELWVYDTRNDGDTVWVARQWGDSQRDPVRASGDAVWDVDVFRTPECSEGAHMHLKLYDSVNNSGGGTDLITSREGTC